MNLPENCQNEDEHSGHGDRAGCLYIRRLVSGRPFPDRTNRRFLVLQIWFDDSGKGHGPAFVLAGYLATVEDWCGFADDWKTLLHKGPRPLDYIKGYEAFGFNRQFIGWNEIDRDARLREFLEIIDRYSGKGLAIVIPHDLFTKILKQTFQPFKNPYMFAYALSFSVMLGFAEGNPEREPIELIFDRDVIKRKQAENAYRDIYRVYSPEVTALLGRDEPRFEDDKQFNPLQASDLLAYCVRVRYETDSRFEAIRRSPIYESLAGGHPIGPYPGDLYGIGDHTILLEVTEAQMNEFKARASRRGWR